MLRKYNILVEKGKDGWFISEVIGLPGCHTQGKTIYQLLERTKEAIKAYLETDSDIEVNLIHTK